MNHVRIAMYDVTHGTAKQAAEVAQAPGGLLEIFRNQPGFRAYSVLEVDPVTVVSVSIWDTHEEAEAAVREAAEWVATHLEDRIHRTSNIVADAIFWEGVGN